MTNVLRHISSSLLVAMVAAMLSILASCSPDSPANPAVDESELFLVCNVGMIGQSRAGDTPPIESMQSVRIVILDDKGVVESNQYFSFETLRDTSHHILKLKSRTKKRIFIFANEESVTDIQGQPESSALQGSLTSFFQGIAEGDADFESKVSAIYYQPDFSKAIPLNAMYDVEIPAGERYIEKSFWLVRVATKWTFTFINNRRYNDITIDRFEVTGISDRHFFMPRFTDNKTPVFPGFSSWIDWLKDVSDKSQVNPDNPTPDESGWLTGYDIPDNSHPYLLSYSVPFTLVKPVEEGKPGGGKEISGFYACESKSPRNDGGSVIANEQQYKLHVECTSANNENKQETKSFDIVLTNLRALFRNTHSHVIVTINDGQFNVNATVDVVPYRGCILDPYFGLPRD